ncbi:MAG: polyhydroxyalkanoic acid system family protein [Variovorax sp.]
MAEILIDRVHTFGIQRARQLAREWLVQAQSDYGLACAYSEGNGSNAVDTATFTRPGIDGHVRVSARALELSLSLGFLASAFKTQIEQQVTRKLDRLLQQEDDAAR